MFTVELETEDAAVRLVRPDVARDAPISVGWLSGAAGLKTQRLMGEAHVERAPTLAAEKARMQDFLNRKDQYDWMITHKGRVVGAIWVDLAPMADLPVPAMSIMIGDPTLRGHGIGTSTFRAVLAWLVHDQHAPKVYSRHLVHNSASAALHAKLGFKLLDSPYQDEAGQQWQNVVYTATQ